MATIRTTMMVCDVCKDRNKPAQRYSITFPGEKARRIDLCADDAKDATLEELKEIKSGGRASRKVFKPEEIEAMRGG